MQGCDFVFNNNNNNNNDNDNNDNNNSNNSNNNNNNNNNNNDASNGMSNNSNKLKLTPDGASKVNGSVQVQKRHALKTENVLAPFTRDKFNGHRILLVQNILCS